MALDLSSTALDLSFERPISISEQINGVAHFSFAIDKVAKGAQIKENREIDVEAWDDSLWNVKSVIALAEILADWDSDEEDSGPWRCNYFVYDKPADTMGYDISVEGVDGDCDLSTCDIGDNAIADTSEFFVFSDPPIINTPELLPENAVDVTETAGDFSVESQVTEDEVYKAVVSDSEPVLTSHHSEADISSQVEESSKRTFDKTLLECWFNNDLEFRNDGAKRWRYDINDELDSDIENLSADIDPFDEIMEVSDCEEGSDIVELPVVDEFEDGSVSVSIADDYRSILHDSDLQLFPMELDKVFDEVVPGIESTLISVTEAARESDLSSKEMQLAQISDPSEGLETIDSMKVEPNNNEDDFLGGLLVDLP